MISKEQLFEVAKSQNATDIHVCAGSPIMLRINGQLLPITKDKLTSEQSQALSLSLLRQDQINQFTKNLDYDFMLADGNRRYRINIGYFNGNVGATIRVLPENPKTIDQLHLPDIVKEFAHMTKGLILITGSTSVGKTTTMNAIINEINQTQKKHIVTIEDPIEYLHISKMGLVRQREIGKDTETFYSGLRAALRQDPDVVAIGEMRDYETIKIALTAAETGILVLSTLHVISIDKIIERFLSYSPDENSGAIRFLLAEALQGIIHQELIPTLDGKQRAVCEVLVTTGGAKNIIRRKGGFMLRDVITTGKKHGMITMANAVEALVKDKLVSEEVAQSILVNYPS